MKIIEILDFLQNLSPFESQEGWDNSGFLLGGLNDEVSTVYLSLDIDSQILENIKKNSLIITHHPLIFSELKKINKDKYPGKLIYKMIEKNISLISMHTNFDKSHLNEFVVKEVLKFEISKKDEYICYINVDFDFKDLLSYIKEKLGLSVTKFFQSHKKIKTLGLVTGSGADLFVNTQVDCFLTGDIKYHQALQAIENNLSFIDIGHFESEKFFPESLSRYLEILPLKVIMLNSKNPFEVG